MGVLGDDLLDPPSHPFLDPLGVSGRVTKVIDAILATDARAVISANPGCMLQIEAGLRARGSRLPVLHVVEVLDRAIARRFDGELMRPVANGKRYEVGDREISWWGGDVSGRAVVLYTDAPSGMGELIAPSRVRLEQ